MSEPTKSWDRWERTFVLSVDKEQAWRYFVDPDERSVWLAEPDAGTDDHYTTAGGSPGFTVVINEAVPLERLRWTEEHKDPEGAIELCVVFEDADSGTRIAITQSRFGAIDDENWNASHDGWNEAIADLAFYVRTGIRARRHFAERGATGMMCREVLEGVEVAKVFPGSFAQEVGLQPGDLLLDIASAPVYSMSIVFAILRQNGPGALVPIRYVRGNELIERKAALSSASEFPQ